MNHSERAQAYIRKHPFEGTEQQLTVILAQLVSWIIPTTRKLFCELFVYRWDDSEGTIVSKKKEKSLAMSCSTRDELEAIERAARGESSGSASDTPAPSLSKGTGKVDARRGSSMFSGDGLSAIYSDDIGEDEKYDGDDLLVDFPQSDDEDDYDSDEALPYSGQPHTSATASSGMKRGIEDFDDDNHRSGRRELPGAPMPGSSCPRPPPEKTTTAPATGSKEYRPMVGGFAAAAYEAAREYHYQSQSRQQQPQNIPKRTGPPPSI